VSTSTAIDLSSASSRPPAPSTHTPVDAYQTHLKVRAPASRSQHPRTHLLGILVFLRHQHVSTDYCRFQYTFLEDNTRWLRKLVQTRQLRFLPSRHLQLELHPAPHQLLVRMLQPQARVLHLPLQQLVKAERPRRLLLQRSPLRLSLHQQPHPPQPHHPLQPHPLLH
jgi:hypothetical protein